MPLKLPILYKLREGFQRFQDRCDVLASWPPTFKSCYNRNEIIELWLEKLTAKWPATLLAVEMPVTIGFKNTNMLPRQIHLLFTPLLAHSPKLIHFPKN